MKRFISFIGIIAVIITLSSCGAESYSKSSGLGYSFIMFTDDKVYDIIVDIDGQEFKTKTGYRDDYQSKSDLRETPSNSIRLSFGVHKVKVMRRDRSVIYDKKVVVSNSEPKNIKL